MQSFFSSVSRFFKQETAATTVEYAIMLALIAAVCVFTITEVGLQSNFLWGDARDGLSSTFVEAGVGQ